MFCLQCGRHDLLNRLYQAMGRWDDAVGVASSKDRINLKSTHYAHGRHLESVGDVSGAIRAYEKSGELLFIRISFHFIFVTWAIGLTDVTCVLGTGLHLGAGVRVPEPRGVPRSHPRHAPTNQAQRDLLSVHDAKHHRGVKGERRVENAAVVQVTLFLFSDCLFARTDVLFYTETRSSRTWKACLYPWRRMRCASTPT